jgi:hypothetical protein
MRAMKSVRRLLTDTAVRRTLNENLGKWAVGGGGVSSVVIKARPTASTVNVSLVWWSRRI